MFQQHLPTYIHNFENDPRWQTKSTAHYIFHYFKDSEAEKDIKYITTTQENAYQKILLFLEISEPQKPIEYFLYPNESIKKDLMGDDWYAQSIYNEFRIHVLYTQKDKPIGPHEDTHILSLPWGLSISFFQEGLAEYMAGHAWDGTPHIKYVKEGYAKNLYPPIKKFMDHNMWLKTSNNMPIYFYSLAGAFVFYLINTHGKDLFKSLYQNTNREHTTEQNSKTFIDLYDVSIENAELEFKEWIKKM